MSLMKLLVPAALVLLIWGVVMAVSGVRQRDKLKICSAAGAFTLLFIGGAVLMNFITRPL